MRTGAALAAAGCALLDPLPAALPRRGGEDACGAAATQTVRGSVRPAPNQGVRALSVCTRPRAPALVGNVWFVHPPPPPPPLYPSSSPGGASRSGARCSTPHLAARRRARSPSPRQRRPSRLDARPWLPRRWLAAAAHSASTPPACSHTTPCTPLRGLHAALAASPLDRWWWPRAAPCAPAPVNAVLRGVICLPRCGAGSTVPGRGRRVMGSRMGSNRRA